MVASVGGKIGLIKEDFSLLDDVMAAEDIAKNVYDVKSCYHAGLNLRGKVNDVLLMAYLLEPAKRSYEMNVIRQIAAVEETMDYEQLKGEDVFVYDVQNLNEVSANLQAKLKDMQMDKLYQEIELPLAKMLADMENAGIYINEAKLDAMNVQMNDELHVLEQSIYELAGEIFNINSPKQLGEILFVKLGLPALKKTKTGFSTNAEVLENLIYAHPIIAKILDYRLLNKLKTTYLDGLKALINPDTKRIHTSFNQTVTETGRLSSSEPNLQNIPVRTAEGKKIRSLFEPGEGYDQILSADYSQIELRIMAHMSEDKHFLEAFRQNQDIHQIILQMFVEYLQKLNYKELVLDNYLGLLFAYLMRYQSEQIETSYIDTTQKVFNSIYQYCRLNIEHASLDRAAGELNYSKQYIGRVVKQITGTTFNTMLIKIKIDLTKKYLSETGLSLSYIAPLVGFSDASHLSRVFKAATGTTPSDYRAQSRKP